MGRSGESVLVGISDVIHLQFSEVAEFPMIPDLVQDQGLESGCLQFVGQDVASELQREIVMIIDNPVFLLFLFLFFFLSFFLPPFLSQVSAWAFSSPTTSRCPLGSSSFQLASVSDG